MMKDNISQKSHIIRVESFQMGIDTRVVETTSNIQFEEIHNAMLNMETHESKFRFLSREKVMQLNIDTLTDKDRMNQYKHLLLNVGECSFSESFRNSPHMSKRLP